MILIALLFRQRAARLLKGAFQHLPPTSLIESATPTACGTKAETLAVRHNDQLLNRM